MTVNNKEVLDIFLQKSLQGFLIDILYNEVQSEMSLILIGSCEGCRKQSLDRREHICLDLSITDLVRIYFHKAFDQIDPVCVDIIITETSKLCGMWGYFSLPMNVSCSEWKWAGKIRETVLALLKRQDLYTPSVYVTMGYNSLYESMVPAAELMNTSC